MPPEHPKIRIPDELWVKIISSLPPRDCRTLRGTCRTFNDVFTERAFSQLVCTSTASSLNGVCQCLESDLSEYVAEIQYRHWSATQHSIQDRARTPDVQSIFQSRKTIGAWFKRMASSFHATRKLQSLIFIFDPNLQSVPSLYEDRLALQNLTIKLLATFSSRLNLQNLSLVNILPIGGDELVVPAFLGVLAGLRYLTISMHLFDTSDGGHFHQTILPVILRHSVLLTSLTLTSTHDVGSEPGISLHDATLPELLSLELGHILFDERTGVEEFILRHSGSLQRLKLENCRSTRPAPSADLAQEPEQARSWVEIYRHLSGALGKLDELIVIEDGIRPMNVNGPARIFRYSIWDANVRQWVVSGGDRREVEEDSVALKEFQAMIMLKQSGL
ncbi:hypothetical protein BV25DRAFT_1914621 [Artomyces pyxidatus]|uniref:Uncharacterized protein n=1 Tax=Artomyces pyxidatus TaxID=48021 RepID=A0ACB8T652_9AGAM|nr:hypothetical protein BV25DRAFT_1914621 [Artomyces pyxidatus]